MTCTDCRNILAVRVYVSMADLSAAADHCLECDGCMLVSQVIEKTLGAVLNPEQRLLAEVAASRLGHELQEFRGS